MKNKVVIIIALLFIALGANAQYKEFKLSANGDTLNIVDKKGLKQGKWVTSVGEIRGEPGYEEEGAYKNNEKTGVWRKYTSGGDIIAVENYVHGGKDGLQQYYNYLGMLEREESWRGYNPDAPYDTIAIYGPDNNEVIGTKLVKAEQYSVKHGLWKYYDPQTGRLLNTENYDRGRLVTDEDKKKEKQAAATVDKSDKKTPSKTPEMLEYEKKYSKKKRAEMERDGKTSL